VSFRLRGVANLSEADSPEAETPPDQSWQQCYLHWSPAGTRVAWWFGLPSWSPSPFEKPPKTPSESTIRVACWPYLTPREALIPGECAGWCSESELITYQQPNRLWKINVDTGQQTLLFPPRG
jgi:hypothetical protein